MPGIGNDQLIDDSNSQKSSTDLETKYRDIETEHRELDLEDKRQAISQAKLQTQHHWLCDRIEHARRNLEILIKLHQADIAEADALFKVVDANLSVLYEVSKIGNPNGEK